MQHFKKPALVLAAYLGTFLASLDISIVNVALPTLQRALQTDLAGLQWVINAYAIALSAFMLSAGPLSDRHGHRRMWLASVATFIAGSLVCACATDLPVLVIGRTIQGVAGALLIPVRCPSSPMRFRTPANGRAPSEDGPPSARWRWCLGRCWAACSYSGPDGRASS